MCSESYPKEFERAIEVLPFTKYGISTYKDFKKVEERIHHLEQLRKAGLTSEDIKLYEDNEAGRLEQHCKIESSVLKGKLVDIYSKINSLQEIAKSSKKDEEETSTSNAENTENIFERLQKKPLNNYPKGHPMNELKEIEESLFGHLKNDDIIPITKRRKILRRLERKKERILSQGNQLISTVPIPPSEPRAGSLWDVKDLSLRVPHRAQKPVIGPQKQTMYTIKDSKIVRLEPVRNEQRQAEEFRAVDIVVPVNSAEQQLLEGTKMSIDNIKKMDRFKDYEPGVPSKVLYLKNIAPSVTQEQLALLFNQFALDNGGPVDVRLMAGRMRGQAFVDFQSVEVAIRALDEVTGTILSGRPVVAQFGRNSNRIQCNDR